VAASDPSIEQLLSELEPRTRAIVCETWLAADGDRLLQLRGLAPTDQRSVAHRIRLQIPWDEALKCLPTAEPTNLVVEPCATEAEPEKPAAIAWKASSTETTANAELDPPLAITERHPSGGHEYVVQRRRIDTLKANGHNVRLFPDSLGEAAIALIAEDLEAHGQRVPIHITPSDTIVDGERRCRGAKKLGWDEICVVVGPELTDGEILDHVISACTSARQMSVREQFNIFMAITEQLKQAVGRGRGRPATKMPPIGGNYLSAQQISEIAAAKARFDSVKSAERAKAIFTRGAEELQDRVSRGELSIGGGYELLPKQVKPGKAERGDQCRDDTDSGREDVGFDAAFSKHPTGPTLRTDKEPGDESDDDDQVESSSPSAISSREAPAFTGTGVNGFRQDARESAAEEPSLPTVPDSNVRDNPFEDELSKPNSSRRAPAVNRTSSTRETSRPDDDVDDGSENQPTHDDKTGDEPESAERHEVAAGTGEPSNDARNDPPVSMTESILPEQAEKPSTSPTGDEESTDTSESGDAVELTVEDALQCVYAHLYDLIGDDPSRARTFVAQMARKIKEIMSLSS
jgi:hypothetical protein